MKNVDMPAMPIIDNDQSFPLNMDRYGKNINAGSFAIGLTKREMMAATLPDIEIKVDYKGIPKLIGRDVDWGDMRDVIKASAEIEAIQRVIRADAILAELERTNGQ